MTEQVMADGENPKRVCLYNHVMDVCEFHQDK